MDVELPMVFGMTPEQLVQVLTAVTALVAAIGSVVGLFISKSNSQKLTDVKRATNGLKDEAVQLAHRTGFAEGKAHAEKEKENPNG